MKMIYVLSILFVGCLGLVAQAADLPPSTGAAGSKTERGMAAGSAEDTLQACMARIPKDASIGQRMIAEQGCRRDENEREPFQAVPGARGIQHQQG